MERAAENKLKFIFILAFLYAVFDMLNSASAGNNNSERGTVYFFLILLVLFMTIFTVLKNRFYINSTVIFMFCFSLYFIFSESFKNGYLSWDVFVYLGLTVWWILTMFFITETLKTNVKSYYIIQNFFRIMFVFYSIVIVYGSVNIVANKEVDFARVGYIYHLLALLPLLLLGQEKNRKLIYICVAIFFSIYSFKRGAILIIPLMLLAYYYAESKIGASKNNYIKVLFISIALFVVWLIMNHYTGGALSQRFTREEISDGSGRAEVWAVIIDNLSKRNFWQLLLGIKNNSEATLSTGAHNDWLLFARSYGLVGLFLFVSIIFSIIKKGFYLLKRKSILAPSYMAMCVYILGVCTVSGFYFVHSTFYVMMFIATTYTLSFENEHAVNKLLRGRKEKML